ncbi:hypothetical protein N9917_01995 [Deltaproteobacteria bacterium]|nr:hypothetical protein [Deltaproteobacteria bacterium]
MKNKLKILPLLALCSAAQSSELDNLLNTSTDIVNQINTGVLLVGAATEYAYTGSGLSDGTLSSTAHISTEQLDAYNNALSSFAINYQPYGDVQTVLENHANTELEMMDEAIGVFTEVVVDMITVQEVATQVVEAESPQEEADVQEFVAQNQEMLTISADTVDTYNQSVDDIETHANNASAFLAVASNKEAVAFLEQGAENNNTTAEQATVSYSAGNQWVQMSWANTNNASAVYLNGQSYGLDMYVSEADVLLVGSQSEFYLSSPMVSQGHDCYMYGECE